MIINIEYYLQKLSLTNKITYVIPIYIIGVNRSTCLISNLI